MFLKVGIGRITYVTEIENDPKEFICDLMLCVDKFQYYMSFAEKIDMPKIEDCI